MYYLYLIECEDESIYTGITTDLERRFKEHKSGKGGRYTRSHLVKEIIYTEEFKTKSEALKREMEIKGWDRKKKIELVKSSLSN